MIYTKSDFTISDVRMWAEVYDSNLKATDKRFNSIVEIKHLDKSHLIFNGAFLIYKGDWVVCFTEHHRFHIYQKDDATFEKIPIDKNKSWEELTLPKMKAILNNNGLQITLKILCDALDDLINKRGPSIESVFVLEALKGIYAGYMRRSQLPTTEVVGLFLEPFDSETIG